MGEIIKFEQVIESYISGDWGNDVSSDEAPCPVSCIRGADIIPIRNSDFANIPIRYISSRSLAAHTLQEGDIVIEKSGGSPTQSTGRVVYISKELLAAKGDVVCSNFCVAFRVKAEWNPKYIYYYLCNIYNADVFFNFEGKTSGLKNLQVEAAFKAIPIKKIAIEEQTSIANTLSIIESKLAVNRQINDNLEAMAKQLYDYWFVQFDFPNEDGKPYKSSGGKMVWNDKLKREIPEGWEDCKLREFINLFDSMRFPLSSKDRESKKGIYPYYGATGIMDYVDDFLFDGDYILLAEDGSTSDIHGFPIVQYIWGKNWVNNHAHVILPKDERFKMFTYHMLKNIPAKLIETGSIQKKISQENLCGYNMMLPNRNVMEQYDAVVTSYWEMRKNGIEEINALIKQRDELLPLLMNGQVSVNYHLSDD